MKSLSRVQLCDSADYGPPGSSGHGDSPGKNTGVGCHFLLQGIFLTQGLNPGLLHCRQILYHMSSQEAWPPTNPTLGREAERDMQGLFSLGISIFLVKGRMELQHREAGEDYPPPAPHQALGVEWPQRCPWGWEGKGLPLPGGGRKWQWPTASCHPGVALPSSGPSALLISLQVGVCLREGLPDLEQPHQQCVC